MKILIDTHIALWAVLNDPKLPKRAKDIILESMAAVRKCESGGDYCTGDFGNVCEYINGGHIL